MTSRLTYRPKASFRHSHWKNGGGETIEIAVFPEGADLEAFAWRVSMARVERSGPFSNFPGIDRTLLVLERDGIALDFGDRGRVELDRASAPFAFPADVAVVGLVAGSGIRDLNVMTRRGAARHFVSRLAGTTEQFVTPLGTTTIVLALRAGLGVSLGGAQCDLDAGDAVQIDWAQDAGAAQSTRLVLSPKGEAEIYLIDLWS